LGIGKAGRGKTRIVYSRYKNNNMTPKEKAQDLIDKFTLPFSPNHEEAKQCALIALDEIFSNNTKQSKHDYWCRVKEELDKL
jgi:hypothetical protein